MQKNNNNIKNNSYGFVTYDSENDASKVLSLKEEDLIFKENKLNIGHAFRKKNFVNNYGNNNNQMGGGMNAGMGGLGGLNGGMNGGMGNMGGMAGMAGNMSGMGGMGASQQGGMGGGSSVEYGRGGGGGGGPVRGNSREVSTPYNRNTETKRGW